MWKIVIDMALDIVMRKSPTEIATKQWRVGQGSPVGYSEVNDVLEIQASGDELGHIYAFFPNVSFRTNVPAVRWFGDEARFIVGNLTT